MIEQSDKKIQEWVATVLGATPVAFTAPGEARDGPYVSVYLLGFSPMPPLRMTQPVPRQIRLRYLVTTWADAPEDAHRMLGELIFAAMDRADFDVDLEPFAVEAWVAFGVTPRPAFVLSVPLRIERPQPRTPLVRAPLVVEATPVISIVGQVVGPNNIPLAAAHIALPALQLTTDTDSQGHFRFPTVPRSSTPRLIHIKARGREQRISVTYPPPDGAPLVIRFNITEE